MNYERTAHENGTFTDWHTFYLDSAELRFQDVDQKDQHRKLEDMADFRLVKALARGARVPLIVTFGRLWPDMPAAEVFPGLTYATEEGEMLCSANSFMAYTIRAIFRRGWMRMIDGTLRASIPHEEEQWRRRAEAVIGLLQTRHELCLRTIGDEDVDIPTADVIIEEDILPVARCAFPSDAARRMNPALMVNSAFFLLEQDDTFHHHAAIGEAHSFWMHDGKIERPPLFRRGAVWQHDDGSWATGLLDLTDLAIRLPMGVRLLHAGKHGAADSTPFVLNDEGPSPVTIYTRYYGVNSKGRVLGFTPRASDLLELTVVDRRIVGWKRGGGLALPHNGFVISLAQGAMSPGREEALLAQCSRLGRVEYELVRPDLHTVRKGIQAGPLLLRDEQSVLHNAYLADVEQFWPTRLLDDGMRQVGVVPTNYPADIDRTLSGRAAVGIDSAGRIFLLMAAGVNEGMGIPGQDSVGATLVELVEALQAHGAVHALNLDGGGSTQAYFQGQRVLVPGDRRGQPGRIFERMIPAVGIVYK